MQLSQIQMDLYADWIETVKQIFRGSGHPFEPGTPDKIVGETYYRQTSDSDEEAKARHEVNVERLRELERKIRDNFSSVIEPDLRKRTQYEGDRFEFKWIYLQGEKIVELNSEYMIPLE